MVRRCCVADCKESDLTILAHRFPKTIDVATQWRNALDLPNFTIDELQKKFVVCTKHFKAAAYRNEVSNSLNTTATPNLDENASNLRILLKGSEFRKMKDLHKNRVMTPTNVPTKNPRIYFEDIKQNYTNQGSKKIKLEGIEEITDVTYVEHLVPVELPEENQPEEFEACEFAVDEEEEEMQGSERQSESGLQFELFPTDEITFSHQETQTEQLLEEPPVNQDPVAQPQKVESKDDKIIKILYPEFEGLDRLKLIELVSDKNQKIEALEAKVKKLEDAMRSFL